MPDHIESLTVVDGWSILPASSTPPFDFTIVPLHKYDGSPCGNEKNQQYQQVKHRGENSKPQVAADNIHFADKSGIFIITSGQG